MLGDLDLKQFLSHYIPLQKGDVLNTHGEVVGYHDGATFLTLGERHGFTITQKTPNDERYYIVAKDVSKNTIIVSNTSVSENSGEKKSIHMSRTTWTSEVPVSHTSYTAQIRYHGEFLPCVVKHIQNEECDIEFETPVRVALGQSIVLYDGDLCLGGGIV